LTSTHHEDAYRTTAKNFLAQWKISLSDLTSMAPNVAEGECLFLSGSITEGLANDQSDIDLVYVGSAPLAGQTIIATKGSICAEQDVGRNENDRRINVSKIEPDMFQQLETTAASCFDTVTNLNRDQEISIMSPDDIFYLNRFRVGVGLEGQERFHRCQKRLRIPEFPEYLACSELILFFNTIEDAFGESEAGHPDSAQWILQRAYQHMAVAVLAGLGVTAANPRWMVKQLAQNRERIPSEIWTAISTGMCYPNEKSTDASLADFRKAYRHLVISCPKIRRTVALFNSLHSHRYR